MKKLNSFFAIAAVALTSVFTSGLTSGDAAGLTAGLTSGDAAGLTAGLTSGDASGSGKGDASGSGKVETKTSSTFMVMPVDFSQAFVM